MHTVTVKCYAVTKTLKFDAIHDNLPGTTAIKNFEYVIENGEATITKYIGSSATVVVPARIERVPVVHIGRDAFYYCEIITNVNIPESVITIDDYAFFDCNYLTEIVIPDSVTNIGKWAFADCGRMTDATLGKSVKSIGEWSFSDCITLESINIPDGMVTIGEYAFGNCFCWVSIVIPDSVTDIGERVFETCSSLTSITVYADNPSYSSENGTLYNKDKTELLLLCPKKFKGTFEIPNSVTAIGNGAFSGCFGLTGIVIPDGVTHIGDSAFDNSSIKNINIPNSVINIGDFAFRNCTSLMSIKITDSVAIIGGWAFEACDRITIYAEADSQPEGWHSDWNPNDRPIVWGYKG